MDEQRFTHSPHSSAPQKSIKTLERQWGGNPDGFANSSFTSLESYLLHPTFPRSSSALINSTKLGGLLTLSHFPLDVCIPGGICNTSVRQLRPLLQRLCILLEPVA